MRKYRKRRKYIYLINPEGKKVRINNITKFAKENNMSVDSLYSLSIGRRYCLNGWKSLNSPKKEAIEKWQNTEIINLKTKQVCKLGRSLVKLCKELNISQPRSMSYLVTKDYIHLQDWVLMETYNILYP